MPSASDTPARPKPETAVGKTPAVPIRSLHDKALKSLARRMTGYTQKEIKTIYEYDPDGPGASKAKRSSGSRSDPTWRPLLSR